MSSFSGFRLVKQKWKASAFDGEGARRYGGRWNSRGKPAIYLAASQSLALLEIMVHLNDYRLLQSYAMFEVRLPSDGIETLAKDHLPSDWRAEPAPSSTAEIGDVWLGASTGLALAVPSVIIPQENNYLLNPAHNLFAGVVETATEIEFSVDPRL